MANWLDPISAFIGAAKSGADVGATIARLQNDKQEAAAKLAQAADAEEMQNRLGYDTLRAKQEESQQNAAEKLQQAMATQAALRDYRGEKLDQGQQRLDLSASALDALNNYRGSRLAQHDTSLDQGQQRIDQATAKAATQAEQFAKKLEANTAWRNAQYGGSRMSQIDKGLFDQALNEQTAAAKALMQPYQSPDAMNAASNTLNQAQSKIDAFKSKYPDRTTSTGSTSAADALTGPGMGARQLVDQATMPADKTSDVDDPLGILK